MNILSIDTSTSVLSIALKTEKSYEERVVVGNFAHSENLLPEIKSLLSRAGLTLKDLNLLICTKGPGSFTGLRVGMASLKGISLGSDAPLVSVPTLSVITEAAKLWQGPILSVIDARKKKFYFRLTNGDKVLLEDRDGNPEDINEAVMSLNQPVLVTGPDAALFYEKTKAITPDLPLVLDEDAPRSLSKALLKLGVEKFESAGPDDIGEGPVYIRRSDAEEMLLAKAKEAEQN